MSDASLPQPSELHDLIARGSGANVAATVQGARDDRLRLRLLPGEFEPAMARVLSTIRGLRGWRVVAQGECVLVATRTTRLFRFTDDIAVLLEPIGNLTAVSARSASRIGRRDFGQNRRNLAELWRALGAQA